MEVKVVHDAMIVPDLTQGSYPENFMLIFLFEMCQERSVFCVSTWMMLRISDMGL